MPLSAKQIKESVDKYPKLPNDNLFWSREEIEKIIDCCDGGMGKYLEESFFGDDKQ